MRPVGVGAALSSALAVAAFPAAWVLDRMATEVQLLDAFPPDRVVVNRGLDAPSRDDPELSKKVASLYGIPLGPPTRVLLVPRERFVHPEELPSLALLPVDKARGEDPLQMRTVRFFAKWTALGAALVAFPLLVLSLRRRR